MLDLESILSGCFCIQFRKKMHQDSVQLKIPTARVKLQSSFPSDPKGDFRLVFKSKVFSLQKAHLRLESGYFKKSCLPDQNILQVKENFNEQSFTNIISCFYGATIKVDRSELPGYFPIVKFLEIESLINLIRKDLLENIEQYDLFVVMKIAHTYSDQKLFEVCLEQLQKEQFEQLKYHQFDLLQIDLPLFKLIIKTHNRFKSNGGNGIPYREIDQLLKEYCENKTLGEERYHELKFELIDKTSLTSAEYKQIFLDQAIRIKTKASAIMNSTIQRQSQIFGNSEGKNDGGLNKFVNNANLAESVIGPSSSQQAGLANSPTYSSGVSNELTLEMENTFEKKKNEELKNENRYLAEELENLKKMTISNSDIHRQMQNQLYRLKDELKRKETIEHEHKRKITTFENIISKMQNQLQQKSKAIKTLGEQFEELKKRKPLSDEEEEEEEDNPFVQSTFLPAHLINEMMTDRQSKPKPQKIEESEKKTDRPDYENMDEEDLEELYLPRLKFDIQPISTPKYHLPILASFVCGEDFNRKVLSLIYRRSNTHPPQGRESDLRGRNNLLILFTTVTGQNVGGFVSVSLPQHPVDYVKDPGAFLFTLSKNMKFDVKRAQAGDAIFLSDQYLISFANDLMISNECLVESSSCSWPSCYESDKPVKERGPGWLVGGGNFLIREIEVYDVTEEEMQMQL